ncbi:MAG: HAD hydrolase-like protein [Candidatus Omnitrophica bacterium]|nr:HAD hydrolase-like protein [Candidatus Omnitrophota bacterium]
MIKCVIFDFDGVIAESVDIKTDAFQALFKDYPQHIKAITEFHVNNGGISRYEKFKFIYINILKEELSQEKFDWHCDKFSELVVEKVVAAPFVKGARELLDACYGRYEMFIVSGTPETEIKEIIKRRGLVKYFLGIFGSPATKFELISNILKDRKYSADEAVFIGDSINDLDAAREARIRFIGRITGDNFSCAAQKGKDLIFTKDMAGVLEHIKQFDSIQIS